MSLFSLIDQALSREKTSTDAGASTTRGETEASAPAGDLAPCFSFPDHRPETAGPPPGPDPAPPAPNPETREPDHRKRRRQAGEELRHFQAGHAWIFDHLSELRAAGWTGPALFRRSPFSWPCGPWGAAWIPAWSAPGLQVHISERGEIVFTFPSGGRLITQRIKPVPW